MFLPFLTPRVPTPQLLDVPPQSKKSENSLSSSTSSTTSSSNSRIAKITKSASLTLQISQEALTRNVVAHNAQLKQMEMSGDGTPQATDDVNGDMVTQNNANARLSSLQHLPKKGSKEKRKKGGNNNNNNNNNSNNNSNNNGGSGTNSAGDNCSESLSGQAGDSFSDNTNSAGGDESFPSRDDSASDNDAAASSAAKTSSCKVCLIRKDLTTVWCETTYSTRQAGRDGEGNDDETTQTGGAGGGGSGAGKLSSSSDKTDDGSGGGSSRSQGPDTELILSLRPIRDGDVVSSELAFVATSRKDAQSVVCKDEPASPTGNYNSVIRDNGTNSSSSSPPIGPSKAPASFAFASVVGSGSSGSLSSKGSGVVAISGMNGCVGGGGDCAAGKRKRKEYKGKKGRHVEGLLDDKETSVIEGLLTLHK